MVRPFDDTTRRNIAELCAAFTRAPSSEIEPGAEAGRRGHCADGSRSGGGTTFLLTRRAATPAFARRPMGAAGRALRRGRDAGAGRAARIARRTRPRPRRGRCARPARRLSDPVRLPDHAGGGLGGHQRRLVPNPDEVASVHRIALDDIERGDAFSFTTIPESTRRVIRFRHAGQHHPRADGGADLSVSPKCWPAETPASRNWNSRCLRGSRRVIRHAKHACEVSRLFRITE